MPEPITTKSVSCDAEGDAWASPLADPAALCCVAGAQEGLKKRSFLSQGLRTAVLDKRARYGFNTALHCMPCGCHCGADNGRFRPSACTCHTVEPE